LAAIKLDDGFLPKTTLTELRTTENHLSHR
jgi:hypothetical protein